MTHKYLPLRIRYLICMIKLLKKKNGKIQRAIGSAYHGLNFKLYKSVFDTDNVNKCSQYS